MNVKSRNVFLVIAIVFTVMLPLLVNQLRTDHGSMQKDDDSNRLDNKQINGIDESSHADKDGTLYHIRYTIPDHARIPDYLIAKFDSLRELQEDTDRYEVTGMLADPALAVEGSGYTNNSMFFGTEDTDYWENIDWKGLNRQRKLIPDDKA